MIGRLRHRRPAVRPGTSRPGASRPGASGAPWTPLAWTLALSALLAPLGAAPAAAQASGDPVGSSSTPADTAYDGPTSEVYGQVVDQDDGSGVGQATLLLLRVVDDSTADSVAASTDDDGAFRLQRVPVGTYALTTDHLGFEQRRDTLRVPVGKSVEIEIPLSAEPVRLEPLEVDVRADWLVETGFYERREKGFGKFLTPEELEKRPLNSLGQALRTLPGVKTVNRCRGLFCDEVVEMSSSAGRIGCPVKFYMDGNEMHGTVRPDNIAAHDLAAIEVYRGISETPAQFYGRCGSVVIWSER